MTALTPVLQMLCPMHVRIDPNGGIVGIGPTLRKLRPRGSWLGAAFLDRFELVRPAGSVAPADLPRLAGARLTLRFRDPPCTPFKGVLVPDGTGGAVINLSFGIGAVDAVQDYALTGADFGPTDLTVELLYLAEAKTVAMDATQSLARRLQVARIAAEEQASTDTLTGLKNRRAFDAALAQRLAEGHDLALLHLDLDYFKQVNDTHGHGAGDAVLQETARRMASEMRHSDVVARIGGDEFMLVVQDNRQATAPGALARRLIAILERPIAWHDEMLRISASIGIAQSSLLPPGDAAGLIAASDSALYAAKRAGRGRWALFNAIGPASVAGRKICGLGLDPPEEAG